MRPGYQTTEFWLSLLALVLLNVGAALAEGQLRVVLLAVGNALVAAGYSLSRGLAKSLPPSSALSTDEVISKADEARKILEDK